MELGEKLTNKRFYDMVASSYDAQLAADHGNYRIRSRVASYVQENVVGSCILDFGGGTGLDLTWLLKSYQTVIFCEPSNGMRESAMKKVADNMQQNRVIFLNEEEQDFANSQFFETLSNVDGVLANFAVLNNIYDLEKLFHAVGKAMKPRTHFIATVLDTSLKTMLVRRPVSLLGCLRLMQGESVLQRNRFNDTDQMIYFHPLRKLQKASSRTFDLVRTFPLGGFGFRLLHLVRK